jgi:hypothetical protein
VLAEKGGVEVVRLRLERRRVLQILFDSDYNFHGHVPSLA